jgi:hypothetical protein
MSLFNIILGVHVVAGSVGIVAGALALFSPKPVANGQGAGHMRTGRIFLRAQTIVLIAAAAMTVLHFQPYLLALTTSVTFALFSGYRVLGRRRPDLDRGQRAKRLDWIAVAASGLIGCWLLGHQTEASGGPVAVVRATTYTLLTYVVYDLVRFVWPLGFPFSQRLWLYEHLVKITLAYFGAMAAFSGNAIAWIPDPWRQLWATILGVVVIVVLVVRYVRYFSRPRFDHEVERAA